MGHHHDEAEDEQIPFWLEGAAGAGHHIVVTAAKRHWLDEHLERQWRRPPTSAESDRFVADYVREEILYREALALGLDRNDLVVRRRLVQKMEMLALQGGDPIGDADLMDHYLAHRADFTVPAAISFRHVFFSAAVRGRAALSDARAALTDVPALDRSDGARVGDPAPVPADVTDWTRPMVEDRFGAGFAASVFECDTGTWSGPFASAYGVHLVFVSQRSAERTPDFAEVADRIATDMDTIATQRRARPDLRGGPRRLRGRDRAGSARGRLAPHPRPFPRRRAQPRGEDTEHERHREPAAKRVLRGAARSHRLVARRVRPRVTQRAGRGLSLRERRGAIALVVEQRGGERPPPAARLRRGHRACRVARRVRARRRPDVHAHR